MDAFPYHDIQRIADDLQKSTEKLQATLTSTSLDELWDEGVSLVIDIEKKTEELHALLQHYHAQLKEITKSPADLDIDALLDALGARFQEILNQACTESSDEESFFASLGVEQFFIDEMLVATMPAPERTGEAESQEQNDHLVLQKLRLLLELLYEHNCRSGDFYIVHGKNNPKSWRYRPYFMVIIPKFQRMVVMNAAYGAATFILPRLYGWKEICRRDGHQLQEELGAHRVIYKGESLPEGDAAWKEEVTRYLFGENSEIDIVDTKQLSKQELYRYHIQKQVPTPEEWMGMSRREKENFKPYGGKKLPSIARIFGVEGNPITNNRTLAELGMVIYGRDHIVLACELWTRDEWQGCIKNHIPTPKAWMSMTYDERLHFKPTGRRGLNAIASIFGVKGHVISNTRVMAELGVHIYGSDEVFDDVLVENPTGSWTQEDWRRKLMEIVPTPEEWMRMNQKEKQNFKPYGGKGLGAIGSVFGVKGGSARVNRLMAELGVHIYGKHEVFDRALVEDPTAAWTREIWQKKLMELVPTPEAWMNMNAKEKQGFKPFGEKGLRAIATIFGVPGDPSSNTRLMAKLGAQIYGADHEVFITLLDENPTVNWTREVWQSKLLEIMPTPEEWMKMSTKERAIFKPYGGKGITYIARIFGVEGDPSGNNSAHAELGIQIYGGDHEILNCQLWSREEWQKKLLEVVPTPAAWMEMSQERKLSFKPNGGKGLIAIARIFGVKGSPISSGKTMAELGIQIFGNDLLFEPYLHQ